MEPNINIELCIGDETILYFESIKIIQSFNNHCEFEAIFNHDVIEETGSSKMDHSKSWIGLDFLVSLNHGAMEFKGIICEVGLDQGHGLRGNLVVSGYSPTILLETGGYYSSYNETNLQKIVAQIIKRVPSSDLNSNISPSYGEDIVYLTQFNESNFDFLNRLSAEYGEFFYYDGKALNFGKPDQQKDVKLVHGQNLNTVRTSVRAKPQKFSYYSYNSEENTILDADSDGAGADIGNDNSYAYGKSNDIFSDKTNSFIKPRVKTKSQLDKLINIHGSAAAANLTGIVGESTNASLNIGCIADVNVSKKGLDGIFNQDGIGKYLITQVIHHIDGIGRYKNNFKGIDANVKVVQVENVKVPQAVSQVGTVTDNNDPKQMGRVKVQQLWQKSGQTTDWIRILTPDAGSSTEFSKNRGHVFIPEVGDQVILGFRYNDPDRPFVMGSIFHGETGAGGLAQNHRKSISTRSGHLIEFDDSDGKEMITITDKNSNIIKFDTNASSILITAPETINIKAKNINITADENVSVTAGENITGNAGENITQNAGQNHTVMAENITMVANDNIHKTATSIEKTAEHVTVNSTKDNIELNSSKQIINKSGSMVKLF